MTIKSNTSFFSKVAGVTAKNPDGHDRQHIIRSFCKPGQHLILKPEPDNPFDKNAISLWVNARVLIFFPATLQIGFFSATLAKDVVDYMKSGGKITAQISDITGGNKRSYGVNIKITTH